MIFRKMDIKATISASRLICSVQTVGTIMTDLDRLQFPEHTPRHPELVSGSISPRSQALIRAGWMLKRVQHDGGCMLSVAYRGQTEIYRQIDPLRVFRFDQINFPLAMPVFQLFLSRDRAVHVVEHLKSDKAIHRIFGGIPGRQFVAMLVKALDQVRCYADVQRAVGLAGEYVDAGLFRLSHGRYMDAPWTLKQVQGDAFRGIGRY